MEKQKIEIIIGGKSQGKLAYALKRVEGITYEVYEASLPNKKELEVMLKTRTLLIVNRFHEWVNKELMVDKEPEKELDSLLEIGVDCVFISDEIGNGIVPVDAFEREYRERTGRMLINLAKQADEVVRVICGIGQKIK